MFGLTEFKKGDTYTKEQRLSGNYTDSPEPKLLFNKPSMKECLSVLCGKILTENIPLKRYSTITTIHMLLCMPEVQQVSSIYSGFCTVSNIDHYFISCPYCGLLHTVLSHFCVFNPKNYSCDYSSSATHVARILQMSLALE